MKALENKFRQYFLEFNDGLVRNLFKLLSENVPDDCQYELSKLKTDLEVEDMFDEKSVTNYGL